MAIKCALKLLICATLLVIPLRANAQVCCVSEPSSQSTTPGGPDSVYVTATDFSVFISGGSGNFSGWTVGETTGAQGSDSCWNSNPNLNQFLVPQYPGVANYQSTVSSSNTFQDRVGWTPDAVQYIRTNFYSSNPIITTFPCGFQVNQQVWIECPGSSSPIYFASTVLTAQVQNGYVFNCRQDRCATINQ